MKKIMFLAIVTVAAVSSGCSQCGPRTSWFRGDACSECATYKTTPSYDGYTSGVVNGYSSGVSVPELPALPGPAPTN